MGGKAARICLFLVKTAKNELKIRGSGQQKSHFFSILEDWREKHPETLVKERMDAAGRIGYYKRKEGRPPGGGADGQALLQEAERK